MTEAETVRQIVSAELTESPTKITLVEEQGNVNKAFDITTNSGNFIIRIRFNRHEMQQFIRERYCASLIRTQYDWTPEIVAIGKFEEHCYSIQRKVHGVVASQYKGDMVAIWEQVGNYAAFFHAIKTPGYLNNMMEEEPASNRIWCQSYFDFLGIAANAKLVTQEYLTVTEFDTAIKILEPLKDIEFKPTLAHGNLSPKNIIIDSNHKAHIIDWGSCQGHMAVQLDLSELLAFDTPSDHVQAYLQGHDLPNNYIEQNQELLERLKLVRCFMNAHWLCESDSPRKADLLKYVERVKTSAL